MGLARNDHPSHRETPQNFNRQLDVLWIYFYCSLAHEQLGQRYHPQVRNHEMSLASADSLVNSYTHAFYDLTLWQAGRFGLEANIIPIT
jgi:hypothetical protein